jgi:hypothetical protein
VLTENAAFDNAAAGVWNLAGASTFAAGTNTLTNEGTIDTTGTSSITTGGSLSVTNTGTVNVQSGSLDIAAPVGGTGQFHIGNGATLEFGGSVAAGETITFQGSTGTLKLDDATHFAGQISGLSGSDGIDLAGFDFAHTSVTPVISSTSTVLTITDENHTVANGTAAVITLLGNYTDSSFNFSDDMNGGVLIVDPPATTSVSATIAARGIHQPEAGTSDNFVFNFAAVRQAMATNFHAEADVSHFEASMFARVQTILHATRDEEHGNSPIALDVDDLVALTGAAKAHFNQADLHLV